MSTETLSVIMPVYNEEGAIGAVLEAWVAMLATLPDATAVLHVYNDGSKDGTAEILRALAARHPGAVAMHHKANSGHGPTILLGYREHATSDWLFQIDSDGEIGPEKFPAMWARRGACDFLIGRRENRHAPPARRLVSWVTKVTVRVCYGAGVSDINCPFRLMRGAAVRPFLAHIPADTFAPNVLLSGLAARHRWRIHQEPVLFSERTTGEVSIRKWKLFKAAVRSFGQTVGFAISPASAGRSRGRAAAVEADRGGR